MSKVILSLVLLAIFAFSSSNAQDCAARTDCGSCNELSGCGWCASTQTCLAGNAAGPTGDLRCLGEFSWDFGAVNCQNCSALSGCQACIEEPDCQWCGGSQPLGGACGKRTDICSDPRTECPCEVYAGCSDCVARTDCVWCDSLRTCAPSASIPPDMTWCPFSQICKCSSVVDCFECKSQEGCGFCAVDDTCYNLAGFPSSCLPAKACPVACSKETCGNRVCGPFDSCSGSCGTCDKGQHCTNDGRCEKVASAAGHFIGGMILGIGLVVLAVFGYAFYKKRQTNYSNLA